MRTDLPAAPDFDAIQPPKGEAALRQTQILSLIGNLGLSWSNNESLFVYVLMLLLRTDEVTAALVFGTLNTSRARLDLIRRLASVKLTDPAVAQTLERLIRRFNATTKVRNDLTHAMSEVNAAGEITHTNTMRIVEHGGRLGLGTRRPMDDARVRELTDVNRQLTRLNRDLWQFLPVLAACLDARVSAAPDRAHGSQSQPWSRA
ncbi:hypothetical protein PMNALOAF_2815 [Methylobacterium adhaesivum]|uniref:DUF4158 domain-containing protein n=1 Tax=Methylobacterium adhaesivum TaxID=333297 RepID=A0ABT8BCI9_9HYPH|nr:hypothetical protein [Methylobacterium adhaesivum]MDN3589076.1 hypothetical protein [Methylobacterium adhaesivum]GJD31556.1 hypothetical protein PMNALOAF_2815 [Methylobacterium adhaesivum]